MGSLDREAERWSVAWEVFGCESRSIERVGWEVKRAAIGERGVIAIKTIVRYCCEIGHKTRVRCVQTDTYRLCSVYYLTGLR